MKYKYLILFLSVVLLYSCSNTSNDPEFMNKATGRYLYNSDEVIEVYFKENKLYLIWRGAKSIKPLRLNDTTFFVKEMNEKIQFLKNPSDQKDYIVLVPKEKNKSIEFNYRKLTKGEKIPSEYLENNEFDNALKGYQAIKEKDSLDSALNERNLNSLGYRELRKDNYENAIAIFSMNVTLHPTSYNVYDSLGEAFLKSGDTAQALVNYKKSLVYDSGNKRIKRTIERLEKRTINKE